jgi:hypothetical protein
MSWINPITDLGIAMQGKNVTYIDLEVFGLPTNTQEGLVSAVESLTTSITNKVDASEEFTPVEREFLRALMANVADNGLDNGNEYKQLPQPKSLPQLCKEYETVALDLSKPQQNVQTYSPVEMIEQILAMDAPARTRLVMLGHVIASDSKLASAYAKQFDQLQTEYAVQQTTQKEGFDK